MINLNIGNKLKQLRLAKSITQKDVARALGISSPLMCAYENDTRIPTLNNLIKIANFYRTSLDYICGVTHSYVIDLSNFDKHEIKKILNFIDLIEEERIVKDSLNYQDNR